MLAWAQLGLHLLVVIIFMLSHEIVAYKIISLSAHGKFHPQSRETGNKRPEATLLEAKTSVTHHHLEVGCFPWQAAHEPFLSEVTEWWLGSRKERSPGLL